jgi:hypothetical protein
MNFPERFRKIVERTPGRLKEEVYDFGEEQGYRIGELESEGDELLFHVLDNDSFTVADKKTHEKFRTQICLLSDNITAENLLLVEDPAVGCYLKLEATY